ncbi:MAG: NADH-quinone oxidoreductase subunit NuoE [Dehalococcoidales bacterium]|nr:MAG: NADH-quinone oxidoreductase subunit NuoE [Dehalococcoidales bacterium]
MTCECEINDTMEKVLANHTAAQRDDLIPILQETQEALGYVPPEAMQKIASFLGISPGVVLGVATFYAQFKSEPSGKTKVSVCRGTACHVRGGTRILREVKQQLGIKPGETTEDMEYSLETVACIGACALAPNITINDEVHGQITTKKVGEIFSDRTRESTD